MSDADAFLEEFLRDRSVECPSCTYDLRNLVGTTCPECGQDLCIRVALEEPNWSCYVVGLVALSMSLGFSALLLIYAILVLGSRGGGLPLEFVVTVLGGLIVSLPATLLWIRSSRRLRRAAPAVRWSLAVGSLVIPITNVVVFAIFVN